MRCANAPLIAPYALGGPLAGRELRSGLTKSIQSKIVSTRIADDARHDGGGLAACAASREAAVQDQRAGCFMTPSSNGQPSDCEAGSPAGSHAASGKPAPDGAAKKVSEVLGEIVWLMSQSPLHKQFFISDLEWLVMTPVLLKQFRLFYGADKPVGVAFWATVSAEVEERLAAGTTRLRPQDWKSGDQLWVVEVIAPFGGAEEMVRDLKAKVFAGREMRFLATGAKGKEVTAL
jgi:cytolysin-activating lysine-acyltransferase